MCDIESNSFGHFEGIGAEQVRLGFIRKVYGIVACQVSVTALAAALACGPLQHPMVAMAVEEQLPIELLRTLLPHCSHRAGHRGAQRHGGGRRAGRAAGGGGGDHGAAGDGTHRLHLPL
ncbi:unnamed protein product [Cladocopium goreaui]|uniref:BI1-like protein n=1 Tax=Cladocopium goreaui TaxID=2562237 RepID=A0A9P1BPI6_9DINO|nr:unnamed protein product [Cladocopium goreaui]